MDFSVFTFAGGTGAICLPNWRLRDFWANFALAQKSIPIGTNQIRDLSRMLNDVGGIEGVSS
jgi:hypothetical protein